MCYPKPGPRCSSHAREKMARAHAALDAARQVRAETPVPVDPWTPESDQEHARSEAATAAVFDAAEAYRHAMREYMATPDGIRGLEIRIEQLERERTDRDALTRARRDLLDARHLRASQVAALSATRNPVVDMPNSALKAEMTDLIDVRMPAAAEDPDGLAMEQARFGAVVDEIAARKQVGAWHNGLDRPVGDGGPSIRAQMLPFSRPVPA